MIYRLKLSDILLSLFVEFCIVLTLESIIGVALLSFISREVVLQNASLFLFLIMGLLSLIMAGAGWKRGLNRIGLILLLGIGWFSFAAGWFSILEDTFFPLTFILSYVFFVLGKEFAFSPWIERIVLIKRNSKYDEVTEQPETESEDESKYLGELFG